jgi:hypothetical protein
MTRLTPSFLLVALKVGLVIMLVSLVPFFSQGHIWEQWSGWDSILPLAAPTIIAPILVWFMFVPRSLEFSETEIAIITLLGKHSYPWTELYCYGSGRGVYKIQFSGDFQPYQIFSGAYPSEEWSKLIEFMKTSFPERERASFSLGPFMRPKGDK